MAFPIPTFDSALLKFMTIYAYTQLPLAVAEGILTVIIFDYIMKLRPDILGKLKVLKPQQLKAINEPPKEVI